MLTACPFSLPSGDGNKDFYRNKIRQHTAEISDGFFSSCVTPNTSFLHLSLLSQFPKNKPSVNIIEAWQPAIGKTDSISHSHFLPLSLDDWGGEIMLEQFGRRPSDCHLMAYTSFLVCVLQNIWPVRKNHEKKKPNNWNLNKQLRWKSISETAAAGDPALDSWITWAGATSHAPLSTFALRLLEQPPRPWTWYKISVYLYFASLSLHLGSINVSSGISHCPSSPSKKEGKILTDTSSNQILAAVCSWLALFHWYISCNTSYRWVFKTKKVIAQFPFLLWELPWLFSR